MASNRLWPCSACAYWQPYPSWEGVGTCENAVSRSYSRMTIGEDEHCEFFGAAPAAAGGAREDRGPRGTTCQSCHYWLPFGTMPRVGQCDNRSSRYFGRAEFSDKPTEECFVERSLDGIEFLWCQTHRETIHSSDLPNHRSCSLFVSSVSLPVEEQMELTVAGD